MSPNGQEALIPVQVYSCGNCGKVAKGMLDVAGLEEEIVPNPDELPSLNI